MSATHKTKKQQHKKNINKSYNHTKTQNEQKRAKTNPRITLFWSQFNAIEIRFINIDARLSLSCACDGW